MGAIEPFVNAEKAAEFLQLSRKHILLLARRDPSFPAIPVGSGARKTWLFRLSDLEKWCLAKRKIGPIIPQAASRKAGS